ncbi:hypothetical protein AB1E18_000563 [Capra hircus]
MNGSRGRRHVLLTRAPIGVPALPPPAAAAPTEGAPRRRAPFIGPPASSIPGRRRKGDPVSSFSVLPPPPPPRTVGKDLASPLRGQRSRVRPAGCKMMEPLRPNLPGDAGWVSCGARILALVRSGPASGR